MTNFLKKIADLVSEDSYFNVSIRLFTSLKGRFLAKVLILTRSFAAGSAPKHFSSFPKIMRGKRILIGEGSSFGRLARLECHTGAGRIGAMSIGKRCYFGDYLHIGCSNKMQIGDNCLFASNVLIIDHGHGGSWDKSLRDMHPSDRPLFSKSEIRVGNNVWVGDCVVIYAGANIPDGAIVPAHSFVDRHFKEYL